MAEEEKQRQDGAQRTSPYVAFKTFLSALDTLKHGIPNQIDRSVFPNMAGAAQSQLLHAFKFFGLINGDGKPTQELSKLVDDPDHRASHIKRILEKGYPNVFALGLQTASPNSVDAELRKFGLTGDTHDKAKSFFLQAAKFAGVTLSPYLLKVTRTSTPRKRRTAMPRPRAENDAPPPLPPSGRSALEPRSFALPGGTYITLGTSVDFLHMPSADRKIVSKLLAELEKYGGTETDEIENSNSLDEEEDV